MKINRILFLLLLCFVVTGCDVSYKLDIDKNLKFNESVTIKGMKLS